MPVSAFRRKATNERRLRRSGGCVGTLPALALLALMPLPAAAQAVPAQAARMSPQYARLAIRNALLIDGTGAPMRGPVDILIESGIITLVQDSTPVRSSTGALLSADAIGMQADREIDATGKYVMPGLIDAHTHLYPPTPRAFVYKLYLGNGVTSLRNLDGNAGEGTSVPEGILAEKHRIAAGDVVAPRMWVYPFLPASVRTAAQVPELVKRWHDLGVDGIKLVNAGQEYPDMVEALGRETRRWNMGLAVHIPQSASPGVNALIAAESGATTVEHHYGYPETALPDTTIPVLPKGYNYGDERQRFRETLALWLQADMERLTTVTAPLLAGISREGRFTMDPTMVVYEKQRDLTRAANVPWLEHYARPSDLQRWRTPDPARHGAIFDRWTSLDEATAAQAYRRWMAFIRAYVNAGGHVSVGADSGGPFQLYGFQTIRELELLLEAGLTPLEVVRAATQDGARVLQAPSLGVIRPGYGADLLIVDENPLEDFKVLMGRPSVDAAGRPQRRSKIRYVVVAGRVMDPDQLLGDVEEIVATERAASKP